MKESLCVYLLLLLPGKKKKKAWRVHYTRRGKRVETAAAFHSTSWSSLWQLINKEKTAFFSIKKKKN